MAGCWVAQTTKNDKSDPKRLGQDFWVDMVWDDKSVSILQFCILFLFPFKFQPSALISILVFCKI